MAVTIVDTDILIDSGRGDITAAGCLSRIEETSELAISAVTQMELLVGCRNKMESVRLDAFLARFQILAITERISDSAIRLLREYRLSHGLLIADALIAATAIVFNRPFATKNQRDYVFISGLNLLPYPFNE